MRRAVYPITSICLSLLGASCASLSWNARRSDEQQRPAANQSLVGATNLARTLVRSTAYGTFRQPVTTGVLGVSVLWHRPHEAISSNMPLDLDLGRAPQHAPGSVEFEQLLDQEGLPKAELGKLKWLVDGPEFFSELDRQIHSARKSIDVQVFIFDNDDIAVQYADRLRERSKDLKVHVLFDDLGSGAAHNTPPATLPPLGFSAPREMANYLEADSKVHARRSINPWLVCDHTKLFVFDQKTAILGGMNVGREYYSEWHDLMVRVEGPIVKSLANDFTRSWRKSGPWGDYGRLFPSSGFIDEVPAMDGSIPMRAIRTDPAAFRYEILKSTLVAIRGTRTRVWVENPYLANSKIKAALVEAAERGVDVRIIIPAEGDSGIMDLANLSTARSLIRAGAKVYRYPRMTHMKVMICDNWASIGSANFDTLSMRINRELNLAFNDPREIKRLEEEVFLPDFRTSARLTLPETESLFSFLAGKLADQL